MALSINSKLKDLLADERAREILIKHLGHRNDPRIDQVMYYSLRDIAYFAEANISKAKLDAIEKELTAL